MADTVATQLEIGPGDQGRRMSLDEFRHAHPQAGHLYELSRGTVEVTDIPGRRHALILFALDAQLGRYRVAHPEVIRYDAGGAGAKIELPGIGSERHPDRSIYLTEMPTDEYPWDKWTPDIVIEVVSPGGDARKRDYTTKRDEYLAAGVTEYWIIDPDERSMLTLVRHGDTWREHKLAASEVWRTALLPGFELNLALMLRALG